MNQNEILTPCFVLEEDKLESNIQSFKDALNSRFKHNILGYSIKTNSTPALLDVLRDNGCFAEVVSYNEYNLVLAKGFSPNCIIYNGPLKSKETFLHAIQNGAYVNIDSKREIEWLSELPLENKYCVGIRLNLNLMEISPEDCKDGELYSRFGFSDENNEFYDAFQAIESLPNIELVGLHLHRTSKTRSLGVYKNICNYVLKLIKKYQLSPSYLDLGGGYYGDMPGKPTYSDYMTVMADALSNELDINNITLIVEPGNALIASPFSFYSSVIDTKYIGGDKIVVIDGSRNDIDPFFHKKDYFKEFLFDIKKRSVECKQVIVGCTCLENDRMFEITDSVTLEVGDRIKFSFVGAYTACISPLFIRYFPTVYVQKGDNFILSREAWSEKEYLQLEK